jgi:hypothetical protein
MKTLFQSTAVVVAGLLASHSMFARSAAQPAAAVDHGVLHLSSTAVEEVAIPTVGSHGLLLAQTAVAPPLSGAPANPGLSGGQVSPALSGGPGSTALSSGPGSVTLSGGRIPLNGSAMPGPLPQLFARPTPLPGQLAPLTPSPAPLPGAVPGLPGSPGLTPTRPGLSPLRPTPLPEPLPPLAPGM